MQINREWEYFKFMNTTTIDLREYLTVREAAEKLDISEGWVRDLIKAKVIRATKIGKWRIKPNDFENFIKYRSNITV